MKNTQDFPSIFSRWLGFLNLFLAVTNFCFVMNISTYVTCTNSGIIALVGKCQVGSLANSRLPVNRGNFLRTNITTDTSM